MLLQSALSKSGDVLTTWPFRGIPFNYNDCETGTLKVEPHHLEDNLTQIAPGYVLALLYALFGHLS